MLKRNGKMTDIDILISVEVREIRERVGIPMSYLSGRLGVSVAQLSKYELGQDRISSSMLWGLMKIFGLKVSEFFEIIEGKYEQRD
jgi:transcriptional regulator with XRE-family HTH domain